MFGATEKQEARRTNGGGTVTHAELDLSGSTVFLSTPPDYVSPHRRREGSEAMRRMYDSPWVIDGLFVEVDDVEAHHAQAREHGAAILREPEEPGVGYRLYTAEDLEGHRWMFGERLPG